MTKNPTYYELILSRAFSHALASAASCNLRFEPAAFPWLQIEGVLLCVCDDALAGYLSLESSNRAFDAFVIVNLYLCHSNLRFIN